MNPETCEMIAGIARVLESDRGLLTETPFAKFDVLTPREPGRAWQFAKHLLSAAGNLLTSHQFQQGGEVTQTVSKFLSHDS